MLHSRTLIAVVGTFGIAAALPSYDRIVGRSPQHSHGGGGGGGWGGGGKGGGGKGWGGPPGNWGGGGGGGGGGGPPWKGIADAAEQAAEAISSGLRGSGRGSGDRGRGSPGDSGRGYPDNNNSPRPYTSGTVPYTNAPQPYSNSPQPYSNSPQPFSSPPQPYSSPPQPYSGGDPYINSAQPYSSGPDPYSGSPQPYSSGPDPYSSSPQPYSNGPDPYSSPPYPYDNYGNGQPPSQGGFGGRPPAPKKDTARSGLANGIGKTLSGALGLGRDLVDGITGRRTWRRRDIDEAAEIKASVAPVAAKYGAAVQRSTAESATTVMVGKTSGSSVDDVSAVLAGTIGLSQDIVDAVTNKRAWDQQAQAQAAEIKVLVEQITSKYIQIRAQSPDAEEAKTAIEQPKSGSA